MNLNFIITPILKKKQLTKDMVVGQLTVSRGTFYDWLREDVEKRTIEDLKSLSNAIGINIVKFFPNYITDSIESPMTEEKIAFYEEKIAFLEEKVSFYKEKSESK